MAKSYEALRAKLPAASRKKAAEQTRAMLADIRRQEKLTQAALADALGVSQVAISKLERQLGVKLPRPGKSKAATASGSGGAAAPKGTSGVTGKAAALTRGGPPKRR